MCEWPSCWRKYQRPNLKAYLYGEHSIFLLVCLFEVSLRVRQVSSWGLSEAVPAEQGHCFYIDRIIIWCVYMERGRLTAWVSHPVPALSQLEIDSGQGSAADSEKPEKPLGGVFDTWPDISLGDKETSVCGPNWGEPIKAFSKSLPAAWEKDKSETNFPHISTVSESSRESLIFGQDKSNPSYIFQKFLMKQKSFDNGCNKLRSSGILCYNIKIC